MLKSISKYIVILAAAVAIYVVAIVAWHTIGTQLASRHLRQVFARQTQPLRPAVNDLLQPRKPKVIHQCSEVSHSHTRSQIFYQSFYVYKYDSQPVSDTSRGRVITDAATLDKLLVENGWIADRQQDAIKTVTASVPKTRLQALESGGRVPFHKNIGSISCNLEINFDGPSDGISSGTINSNFFSCQQHTSYFILHAYNYVDTGFGG